MDPKRRLAESYDRHAQEREERGEPEWRDATRELFAGRLERGDRILEVGAGVGYSARWFSDQGFDVVATDLSPGNVAKIREKGVTAYIADMGDLPFADGSFAGVWAASCLMHIPNDTLPAVLAEIRRVLADDGLFWSGTWGGPESEGIWEEDFYTPKRFYSFRTDDQMRSFYEANFDVESMDVSHPDAAIDRPYQSTFMVAR
ncbi:MAG: class I SAM-dependent methyltransferase [Acidimicrobiia bacterium]|nr:class I SAM-dependent methyltransferase [Acidimicrobiia bacterium]NNF64100.1 class I SAM-dependent methyltransferase [Acidimicrobiia bacterium]